MKKSEFKKIIKPIVSECIKESLMEDGLISGIIAEVVKGMSPAAPASVPIPEKDPVLERMNRNAFSTAQTSRLREQKNKLMESIGSEAYNGVNLFEGTAPLTEASPHGSPLSGQGASDPGVDIGNLFGAVGNHWGAHMNDVKREDK
tara:strand:+ start:184 stop:621 length:438 start_codon:yes stop_codon:yes gene_type:complete